MSDLIYRHDAIKAIETSRFLVDAIEKVMMLPSAQPEIIRCKECKEFRRWIDTDITFCDRTECETKEDDFCSRAEAKNVEND